MMQKIILASASPRRKELLKLIFNNFEVIPSDIEEIVPENIIHENQPEYLARIKALDIAGKYPAAMVIGADTSVLINGKILGKPVDFDDAYEMIKSLSGNIHQVITGCAVVKNGVCKSFSSITNVEFYSLGYSEIKEYISSSEPYDKAGGYGVQSKGSLFVKGITGDYFNVVGLPIAQLKRFLDTF